MEIHPLIDPFAIHFDTFAGDVYTLDTAGITLTGGTLQAEDVIADDDITAGDDITMQGLFLNTLRNDDATGMYIDGVGASMEYTGTATNYIQRLTRDITGNISASLTSYGTSKVIGNAKTFTTTVSSSVTFITYGDFDDITVSGVHTGRSSSGAFAENNYADWNKLTRSETLTVSGASGTTFNNFGSRNEVVDSISYDNAGETVTITDYGSYNEVTQSGTEDNGTMNKIGYAVYAKASGTADGTSTLYGLFIDSVSGADTNWGLYDNSGADSFIKGNLQAGRVTINQIEDGTATNDAGLNVYGFDTNDDKWIRVQMVGSTGTLSASGNIIIRPGGGITIGTFTSTVFQFRSDKLFQFGSTSTNRSTMQFDTGQTNDAFL
jgi:hypothetical protein